MTQIKKNLNILKVLKKNFKKNDLIKILSISSLV